MGAWNITKFIGYASMAKKYQNYLVANAPVFSSKRAGSSSDTHMRGSITGVPRDLTFITR